MFSLTIGAHAHGTRIESLYRMVDTSGLVITVQGPGDPAGTAGAVFAAAPRLSDDHEVRENGMIVSTLAQFRVLWGVVGHPGGSLAILTPFSLYETQDRRDWISHFIRDVLDPVKALDGRGFRVGGGGNGTVSDSAFTSAFAHAYV
ncbi:hypothetical protein ACFU5Z_07735 [Streptomyces sp. NPDC057521]|uniref:hypothetical protein n=1 Tax=Streptomyces sp. NPDC057521 TaxID=3346156 RepID=UPI00368C2BF4